MDIKTIEDILNTWLSARLKETVKYTAGKDDIIHINSSVLQLEHWLLMWRKEHKLNERIDASIISNNILKNIASASSDKAFQAKDYQFNFLFFLARNYSPKSDLHKLIDSFVDKFKEQFSFADIIITSTGATRCKTNIRFALNELRNMGLVLSKDIDNNRSLSPSIPGLVAMLNIQYQGALGRAGFIDKIEEQLLPVKKVNRYAGLPYDATLYDAIQMFKEETYLYEFLHWLRDVDKTEKEFIEGIIKRYMDFTSEAIEIKENGLRLTKQFKDLSSTFQKELFDNHKKNMPFIKKLMKQFQAKDS